MRRASLLQCRNHGKQRFVEVCQLDLHVRVLDTSVLVQLRTPSGHSPERGLLENRLKRILVAAAPVDRFDMLVHAGKDNVRVIHRTYSYSSASLAAYFSAPRKWSDTYGSSPTTQLSCGIGGM